MPIDFYMHPLSPSCQSVLLASRELGIELNNKHMNFVVDTDTPSYEKINPLKTLPAIDDNGFYTWGSRSIITYLANKYAPGNPLYPQDPNERAVVDRMLYFHIGTFHNALSELSFPVYFKGELLDVEKMDAYKKVVASLEQFLTQSEYVAGNHLTIADITCLTTVNASLYVNFNYAEYPKITAWWNKLKTEISSYEEIIEMPKKDFKEFHKSKQ